MTFWQAIDSSAWVILIETAESCFEQADLVIKLLTKRQMK